MKGIGIDDILPAGWEDLLSPVHPRLGLGLDPATTTKKMSNPSGLVLTQQVGQFYYPRVALRFKTDDPDVTFGLIERLYKGVRSRGLNIRKLCILATNERFFAVSVRKKMAGRMPVELLIESEKTQYLGEEMLYKAYLGNLFVSTIEDGYLALPPEEFIKKDVRQVVRDRGTFDAEVAEDGGHADVFAGIAASLHALKGKGGKIDAAGAQVGTFGAKRLPDPGRKLVNQSAGQKPAWRNLS